MLAARKGRAAMLAATCVLVCNLAAARGTYQAPEDFLREAFAGETPAAERLWIKPELAASLREILGHDIGVLRVRYWRQAERSAWILDETGKEQPITVGVVVNGQGIETLRVLVFREIRGWEVRYPFFTDQFRGAGLDGNLDLDRPVDGISGATLSVDALKRVARAALLLHRTAMQP